MKPALLATWLLASTAGASALELQQALQRAAEHHPDSLQARARLQEARARSHDLLAEYGLVLRLEADARWIDVPEGGFYSSSNDSRISLIAEKTLLDFGRQQALRASGRAWQQAARAEAADLAWQVEQQTAAAYFAVLLADLEFNTANEAMSIAYIRYDRARERLELEQLSDLEVARLHAAYQDTRLAVRKAEHRQRLSREELALLLGPGSEPPAELALPTLRLDHAIPEYEDLLPLLASHPALQALKQQALALEHQARAERNRRRPRLRLDARYTDYHQPFATRSPARASLVLDWPLLDGGIGHKRGDLLEAQANTLRARARALELDLRTRLLATLQRLRQLRVELERNEARRDYRELYLDRSRALYEMEVKTDLGDAMVQQSQVQLDSARSRYQLALTWLELARLIDQPRYKPWTWEDKP